MKKTNVVFPQKLYVVYGALYHGYTVEPHTEGESAVFVGIYPATGKHLSVDHACAQYFYPARIFANSAALSAAIKARNVNLYARLCKRKIARSKTNGGLIAEYKFGKAFERALKVA